MGEGGAVMIQQLPDLLQRCRAWLVAYWRRRWRLTRRGRFVFASLGVLVVFFVSSLVGSWARDPLPAKGLPATGSSPTERSERAASSAGRGFT